MQRQAWNKTFKVSIFVELPLSLSSILLFRISGNCRFVSCNKLWLHFVKYLSTNINVSLSHFCSVSHYFEQCGEQSFPSLSVKLFLCLIKHLFGVRIYIGLLFNFYTRGEWSALPSGRFTFRNHWAERSTGGKNCLCRESNFDFLVVWLAALSL